MRRAGFDVRAHDEQFPQATEDVDWLPDVGAAGWIVLTKDSAIRRRPLERQALANAGIKAFMLSSGNMTGDEMASLFLRQMKRIEKAAAENAGPFYCLLNRGGIRAPVSLAAERTAPELAAPEQKKWWHQLDGDEHASPNATHTRRKR